MRSRETKKLESENSKRINDALVDFSIKGCSIRVPYHGMVVGRMHSQERDNIR